jgi:hypothetical protein
MCRKLAQNAVHCAFSGYTNFTSGFINEKPVMIPVDYISAKGMRTIDTEMDMNYLSMLASTGQPSFRKEPPTISNTTPVPANTTLLIPSSTTTLSDPNNKP